MGYSNGFDSMFGNMGVAGETMGAVLGVLLVLYVVILIISLGVGIVMYVMQSMGIHQLAKRRGIHNSWLAWVPVGNLWILGSLSDQYQYLVKGRIRNRRKALLWLMVSTVVLTIGVEVIAIGMGSSQNIATGVVGAVMMILLALILLGVAIASAVVQYIALYDLFSSANPDNATVYLILSILISVTMPFLVFSCRKLDKGMPPRKAAPAPAAPVCVPAAVQAPVVEAPAADEPARFVPDEE